MNRLTPQSARQRGVTVPSHAGRLSPGIVHLGIGAFARAHTAVFTDEAMIATGDERWGVLGVSQRSATVPEQLAPQAGLFSVATRGDHVDRIDVIASLSGAVDGARRADAVVAAIADPRTHVVTLTITEKGYRLRADGSLDLDDPAVRADIAGATTTAVGQLAAAIIARDGAPLSLVSCDNLPHNGASLRRALEAFAEARGGVDGRAIAASLATSISTPDTMVDRMVPATTAADLKRVAERLGLRDEAAVVAEPYRQWVIADDFIGERPAWELAGAQIVDEVAPWEDAKLRILNASHSLLAYLGLLGDTDTIAETVGVEEWETAARRFIDAEVAPTLRAPATMNVAAYRDQVLERFANPYLGHTVRKVGSDGSQKMGPRIVSTMRAAIRQGISPRWSSLAVAAWATHVRSSAPSAHDDPRRAEVASAAGVASPQDAVVRLLELIAPDLAADQTVTRLVGGWVDVLERGGIDAVKEEIRAEQ